jgi:hypothetical protein
MNVSERAALALVSAPVARAVATTASPKLVSPALVDGIGDNVKVLCHDAADEEDADVVFHRHQLGVIDSRLLGQFFRLIVELEPDGLKAEARFFGQQLGPSMLRIDDAMLFRLHAPLGTRPALVRENRSWQNISGAATIGVIVKTYTQVQCPWSLATMTKRRYPV